MLTSLSFVVFEVEKLYSAKDMDLSQHFLLDKN